MRKMRFYVIFFIVSAFFEIKAFSGEWDDSMALPSMESILFSSTTVGFVTCQDRTSYLRDYFLMNRDSYHVEKVSQTYFQKIFPENALLSSGMYVSQRSTDPLTTLMASNGKEFRYSPSDCRERNEQKRGHKLFSSARLIPTHVSPCNDISAVEVVGDQLWLVTNVSQGVDLVSQAPAEGIVVQLLRDGTLVGKVGVGSRVPLIIKRDAYGNKIWAVSGDGFDVIRPDLKAEPPHYWTIGFDPQTGVPGVIVSTYTKPVDAFAFLGLYAGISDKSGYSKAVAKLPEAIRQDFDLYPVMMYMYSHVEDPEMFVPPDMNPLVPFFVAAAGSDIAGNAIASMQLVCMFKDNRVYEMLKIFLEGGPAVQKQTAAWSDEQKSWAWWNANRCVAKYARSSLSSVADKDDRMNKLLGDVRRILADFESESSIFDPLGTELIGKLKELRRLGNREWISLVEDSLLKINSDTNRSELYQYLFMHLADCEELAPLARKGLASVFRDAPYYGCEFLNADHINQNSRRSQEYAMAILATLMQAEDGLPVSDSAITACKGALKSQLKDPTVKSGLLGFLTEREKTRLHEFIK